jgi:hypothetical protein
MRKRRENIPNTGEDQIHELWLIYCQLKDAETDLPGREQLIRSARKRLGQVLNALHRVRFEPKSPVG